MLRTMVPIVIERDKHGDFAFAPTLQGCYAQGDSYEEALANIEDAIRLHIEDRVAAGEVIATAQMVRLATVEVAV